MKRSRFIHLHRGRRVRKVQLATKAMKRSRFIHLHRGARRLLNRFAGKRPAPPQHGPLLAPREIRSILICRPNPRLGNQILLTPLIRTLARTCVSSSIDIVVGAPSHALLFQGMQSVRNIFPLPGKPAKHPIQLLRRMGDFRRNRYDLAIDPCLCSTSNRLLLRISRARFRLGFAGAGQWSRLTHTAEPTERLVHESLRPLQLLTAVFPGDSIGQFRELDLELSKESKSLGAKELQSITPSHPNCPRIGFFAEAAGRKRLPAKWWLEFLRQLQIAVPGALPIQILPPGHSMGQELCPIWYRNPHPRRLAGLLANLDLFISADTGPLHLASAAAVPTVGIFTSTNPVQYAPLREHDLYVEESDPHPAEIARRLSAHLESIRGIFGKPRSVRVGRSGLQGGE